MENNKKIATIFLYLIAFVSVIPGFIYLVSYTNDRILNINDIVQHPSSPVIYLLLSISGVVLCLRYQLQKKIFLLFPVFCLSIFPILSRYELVRIPQGTVLAFNLSSGCPRGWFPLQEAAGRVIIGVGAGNQDTAGRALTERQWLDKGGAEIHKLTVAEMPAHNHINGGYNRLTIANRKKTTVAGNHLDNKDGGALSEPNLQSTGVIKTNGRNVPHNNMPPYLALHICQKQ